MTTVESDSTQPVEPSGELGVRQRRRQATPSKETPSVAALTDTMVIKRRDRRCVHAQAHLEKLPKVPKSLAGRVLCAHPEIVTAVFSLFMALVFVLPHDFLTLVAAIGVVMFAYGWGQLIRLPAWKTSAVLIAVVGLSAVIAARVFKDFSIIAEVVSLGVPGAFIAEMLRHPRAELIKSVSGNLAGILIVATSGAWIVLEKVDVWYFLLIPGAVTLLGGCVGMAMSANWSTKYRSLAALVLSTVFGCVAGAAAVGLHGAAREEMLIFAGGYLPTLPTAVLSGMILGALIGVSFAVLSILFSDDLSPVTVGAAVSQSLIPVLAAGVPLYILARLLTGEGIAVI